MKFWIPGFCVIVALAAVTRADGQTTRPSNPGDGRNFDRPLGYDGTGRLRGFGGGGFGRRGEMPFQAEWDDISAFMKDHSPERLKAINALPEGHRGSLIVLVAREYRNLQRLRADQPDLADLMTRRIELEDQVFKLASDVKAEKAKGDSRLAADKQSLQQKVGELLDANIKERQARVDRLKNTLAEEEKQLEKDTKNRDQLVNSRVHNYIEGQRAEASPLDSRDERAGDRPTSTTQP